MKTTCLLPIIGAGMVLSPVGAATIVQTFEDGEDTTNWGSTWTGGAIAPAFLDASAGGENAGGGGSLTQSFSRTFRDNTAGLDITTGYSIRMDVQVDSFDGAANGLFEIVDGAYGNGNAANLRIFTEDLGGGNYAYHWQARDNIQGWLDLGLTLDLGDPYQVEFVIDPESFTYSAAVRALDGGGNVVNSALLTGLAFDQNVINNGQNGNLLFYIQASAGGTDARVDNINIESVPEPSVPVGIAMTTLALSLRRKRSNLQRH
ncbi:MAG: PEP-CTERM sorting domain-containing protein [Verrucomicrobiaceae bacterium]|nr:MAG: PEP-CTERM sorting domain-containing protein [Verrucomicrobiaceae bacterium]